MKIISQKFYQRDTVEVAKDLIGKIIVREINSKILTGMIIETEAYCGLSDPASHSYKGQTERNKAMFGPVGHSYIYFIYGNHFCLNIVAKEKREPAGGVLIRGLYPLQGIDEMRKFRHSKELKNLTNGPGKLTQAFHITKDFYGKDLTKHGELYVIYGPKIDKSKIISTPRIGIKNAKEKLWRFIYKLPIYF